VELFEQIRREYEFGVGTIAGVAKKLKVHRRMVREAISSASGTNAVFGNTLGIAIDGNGNVFVADPDNHRIRRIDAARGKIATVAGNGTAGYSGDNGPATNAALDSR
jgi:NHL repeat